jgi:hypothetical protein
MTNYTSPVNVLHIIDAMYNDLDGHNNYYSGFLSSQGSTFEIKVSLPTAITSYSELKTGGGSLFV